MAKTITKRISINEWEKIMKGTYKPTTTFGWHGVNITVKKTLSLEEMLSFVDSVTKSCFESETNTYLPEVRDFAIKVNVLEKYTNFSMPSNVEARYDLIYCTDAVYQVLKYINMEQYLEITGAIEKKVENLAQANIEAVNRQINEIYNAFDNLQSQLSGLFSGVSNEDIQAIAGAMADGVLNEEKLVGAYMNARNGNAGDE